jgi:hypothetical protein
MTYARSIFVIHNIAHQGRAPFIESENLELNDQYRQAAAAQLPHSCLPGARAA